MDDCYFYYYSSCTKGDSCPYRHEPSALGKETVCNFWKQGKCAKPHCNFRHMDVVNDRSRIICYWESQPGGCRKPHCPFQHMSKSLQTDSENGKELILPVSSTSAAGKIENSPSPAPTPRVCSNFDPLVVNFEEESDSESVPSVSPLKRAFRNAPKTLEQIRLEKIQAESAAFYNYENQQFVGRESTLSNRLDLDCRLRLKEKQSSESRQVLVDDGEDLRSKMLARKMQQQQQQQQQQLPQLMGQREETETARNIENIKVMSLEEIREKRRRKQEEEERESRINPPVRLPKQRITFSDEEGEMEVAPVKRKMESLAVSEEDFEEYEELEDVSEETEGSKKPKRPISPVVFDVSRKHAKKEKKSKEERRSREEKKKKKHKREKRDAESRKVNLLDNTKFENIQITASVSSPSKPTVVVVARKRVLAEEAPAAITECKRLKSESKKEKSEKRPERPLWRPSRLAKSEERTEAPPAPEVKPRVVPKLRIKPPPVIKETPAPQSDPVGMAAQDVLPPRKIRLKRPAPVEPEAADPEEPEEMQHGGDEASTSKLSVEIPPTTPPKLSHSISYDDEFDLLSPCSDHDNIYLKASDDKILEDIDALLNE